MPKLLHIADPHLGYAHRYLGSRAQERSREALQTFDRMIDWACDPAHDIAAVLIAGDLFETHTPNSELVGRVLAMLTKLTAVQKTVITVPGNHDEYSYSESVYRQQAERWPGVLVTSPTPERVGAFNLGDSPAHIYAMAYTAGLSPNRLLPINTTGDDGIHIALLHGTLDATPADRSYRIDSQTLTSSGIHYAALGHIHKPQETRIGDGCAVYPGSPIGKGFRDPGVDHLVVVSFSGNVPSVERVDFPAQRIETRTIDLGRYETFQALIDELEKRADAEKIVEFALTGPRPAGFDAAHLQGRLSGHFFHLEIDDLSIEIPEDEIASLEHQPTMRGLFAQLMHKRIAEAAGTSDEDVARRLKLALRKGLTAFEEAGGRTERSAG